MAEHPGAVENPFLRDRQRKRKPGGIPLATRPGANGPRGGLEQPGRTFFAGVPTQADVLGARRRQERQGGIAGFFGSPLSQQFGKSGRAKGLLRRGQQIINEQFRDLIARQQGEGEQIRTTFQRNLGTALALNQQGQQALTAQRVGRRGLAFSGIEQAAAATVAGAGQIALAQNLGEFESKLQAAFLQERQAFSSGAFGFIQNILARAQDRLAGFKFEKALLQFQADLARDLESQGTLERILTSAGQIGGLIVTKGIAL